MLTALGEAKPHLFLSPGAAVNILHLPFVWVCAFRGFLAVGASPRSAYACVMDHYYRQHVGHEALDSILDSLEPHPHVTH